MLDALLHVEQIGAADQFAQRAHAEHGHDLAYFLGDEEEKIHHVLGLALEFLAQHRILGGYADRAGVEMAFAHHDAASHHQRCRREAEFVGTENGADGDVAAGLHLAVDLDCNAPAQAVEHQCLLRLRQSEFPGRSGVLDRGPRTRTGTAIVARNGDVIGFRLGYARCHCADTSF